MSDTVSSTTNTSLIDEPVDLISIDVSFISVKHMFPVAAQVLSDQGLILCLVKPQFEAGREQVGKGGIVRDPSVHEDVISNVIGYASDNGLYAQQLSYSPIKGTKGNIEYLLLLSRKKCDNKLGVGETVKEAHTGLNK